ncbi:phosphatidylinositol transfer protein [Acrasis kona]|uniref:Phosphatidylinositol transfer protein n=1 Tax=Acrasis kona TaxID=1008807 RepID=A0AAW2ZA89_9EUKA
MTRRTSAPIDSTADSLKELFQSHPILGKLNVEQLEKFAQALKIIHSKLYEEASEKGEQENFEQEWASWRNSDVLDDMCIYRYMYGYLWDVDVAVKQCVDMLQWVRSFKPKDIKLKDLESVAQNGYLFHHGVDKLNRPVFYLLIGKDSAPNTEENVDLKFKHLVHTNEQCIKRLEENGQDDIYQILWVVDMKNGSVNLNLVKSLRHLFDNLGVRYPERCGQILILNPPWTLNVIWAFTQQQIDKYKFIKGTTEKIKQELLKYIDEDQIPQCAGYDTTGSWTYQDALNNEK